MTKKIIVLSPAYPLRGGIAAFNERMALEIQKQGHDVQIYTYSLQYPSFLFPGKTQLSPDPAPANLRIKVCVNSINPLNWIKIGNEIKNLRPDILIIRFWLPFMGPCLGTIGRIVARNKYTKIIGFLDNIIPHDHRPGDKAFTKYFVKPCQRFIAMSKSVVEDLKQFTNKPCDLIPHPVYNHYGIITDKTESLNHLKLYINKKYILFFGLVRKYKGLDLLLEAMADKRIQKLGIELIVAGEFYGDEAAYQDQMKQLNIEQKVHLFNEYIPDDQVRFYFGASDLLVQPYRTATQSGISQMAYHFLKPMVVTNVGGLPDLVPDQIAGYVTPVDSTDIANAIVDYFENNRENFFVENLKKEKLKYSWERIVEGVVKD
jgi:glycosyltransferase involved in cell wall biosynthesis